MKSIKLLQTWNFITNTVEKIPLTNIFVAPLPLIQKRKLLKKKLVSLALIGLLLVSCKPQTTDQAGVIDDTKQATIDSMNVVLEKQKIEMAKQKSIDSMQAIVESQKRSSVSTHTTTTVTEKRKGWSRAAKGAVIGAGVGAAAGAIINKKNHGEGAIIGGLAGAGVGAGTGAILDSKKDK